MKTELDRHKQAIGYAIVEMRRRFGLDCATTTESIINGIDTILNPPPATEEVEVVRWTWGGGFMTFNTKEEAVADAKSDDGIYKLTGTITRPVPQKVERNAVAEDVLFDAGHNGTNIWPHGAKLIGDADWGSIIGKKVKKTLTWEE